MRVVHPSKKVVVIWNTLAIEAGLVFGDKGYVYAAMLMFVCLLLLAIKVDFKEGNGSRANYFILGAFALFNFQFFGPIGMSLTIMNAINMYFLYFGFIPMIKLIKATHSKTTTQGDLQ